MKSVEKDEFDKFISSYPKPLVRDIARMCEPPMLSYNDFSDGAQWPESIVAKVIMQTAMKGHPCYKGEPDEYFINV
jgi:hypothetical protein